VFGKCPEKPGASSTLDLSDSNQRLRALLGVIKCLLVLRVLIVLIVLRVFLRMLLTPVRAEPFDKLRTGLSKPSTERWGHFDKLSASKY